MKSTYRVECRAVPNGVYMALGIFEANSYSHAVTRARKIKPQYADWPDWLVTLTGNRSGKNLGRARRIEVAEHHG